MPETQFTRFDSNDTPDRNKLDSSDNLNLLSVTLKSSMVMAGVHAAQTAVEGQLMKHYHTPGATIVQNPISLLPEAKSGALANVQVYVQEHSFVRKAAEQIAADRVTLLRETTALQTAGRHVPLALSNQLSFVEQALHQPHRTDYYSSVVARSMLRTSATGAAAIGFDYAATKLSDQLWGVDSEAHRFFAPSTTDTINAMAGAMWGRTPKARVCVAAMAWLSSKTYRYFRERP